MRGQIRFARVDRVYVSGGHPVADVTDMWGGVYRGVRFLGLGGGAGSFLCAPALGFAEGDTSSLPTDGTAAEVALLFPETLHSQQAQRPWIVAGLMHSEDAARVTADTAAPGADTDYTAHHVTDIVAARGAARVAVSALAGVVLQALPDQPIRLQGGVRISFEGEADDGILLSAPTRAYLDGISRQLEAVRAALVRLEAWADSATGAAGSIPSYVAWPAPGGRAPADAVVETDDSIESAVVTISGRSKGD